MNTDLAMGLAMASLVLFGLARNVPVIWQNEVLVARWEGRDMPCRRGRRYPWRQWLIGHREAFVGCTPVRVGRIDCRKCRDELVVDCSC